MTLIENGNDQMMSLYDAGLSEYVARLTVVDNLEYTDHKGKWIAQKGAWWGQHFQDHLDEISRRIEDKNAKYQGYVKVDGREECWLLMYHEGDPDSDLNLTPAEISEESIECLSQIAVDSPFTKIILFDPYFRGHLYALKS